MKRIMVVILILVFTAGCSTVHTYRKTEMKEVVEYVRERGLSSAIIIELESGQKSSITDSCFVVGENLFWYDFTSNDKWWAPVSDVRSIEALYTDRVDFGSIMMGLGSGALAGVLSALIAESESNELWGTTGIAAVCGASFGCLGSYMFGRDRSEIYYFKDDDNSSATPKRFE